MGALFNVAGGVRYHCRGWRYSKYLWKPFRERLGEWLGEWQAGGPRLVIIGPSAGYCLDPAWLGRFEKIACLDPDPLARMIFRKRLRETAPDTIVDWSTEDFLAHPTPDLQLRALEGYLARYPEAPVLFSNFLGQLSLLLHDRRADVPATLGLWRQELVARTLRHRKWASFHDRFSSPLIPVLGVPLTADRRLTDDELVRRIYPKPKGLVELSDHDTEGLFPVDQPHTYFSWSLTVRWYHLIEATHSMPLKLKVV